MQANRRTFLKNFGLATAAMALPMRALAVGSASQVSILHIVYPGGNWRPRSTALRRLAWELHKRTAVEAALEPLEVKPILRALSVSPLAYLSGDRSFSKWSQESISALSRYIRLGGTLIVDPAFTVGGDTSGFSKSFDELVGEVLPDIGRKEIPKNHVLFRSFYQITRPVGRVKGPDTLSGYSYNGRFAIIRTEHDLGGAWARDNLGNWEHNVTPGGDRQREDAFKLGINMVLYALCLDYKDEEPHRRFNQQTIEE